MRQTRTCPHRQHCDRCVHQPTRWSAFPSHVATRPPPHRHQSLHAIHIRGLHNRAADELSRAALPGKWRLHLQTVQLIWSCFGVAQVDLFASLETSHCQLFYSLTEGTLGTDTLAHSWLRGLRKYAFPPVSLLAQTLCKIREDRRITRGALLAHSDLVPRTDAPRDPLAPASRPLETSCLVPGRVAEVLGDLPQEVVDTITSARAPSTRHAYALKWNLFVKWCSSHRENHREVPEQSRAVLSAPRIGAKAVFLHP